MCQDHLGSQGDQLFRENLRLSAGRRKAIFDADIAFFRPSTLLEPLPECREAGPRCLIVLGEAHQYADPPHSVGLLRARRHRPSGHCAAEKRNERAPLHSITSSARANRVDGTWRPSALAVLRLITSSILVGCSTGSSPGLAPLRIL